MMTDDEQQVQIDGSTTTVTTNGVDGGGTGDDGYDCLDGSAVVARYGGRAVGR